MDKRQNLIFLFHEVSSQAWFRQTCQLLQKRYRFASIEEIDAYLLEGKPLRNACHICFDDGHSSVYESAFPIIQELQIPVSLFVSPKIIQEGKEYWFQQLSRCEDTVLYEVIQESALFSGTDIEKYRPTSLLKSLSIKQILQLLDFAENKMKKDAVPKKRNISVEQMLEMQASGLVTIGAHTNNHPILQNESDCDAKDEVESSIDQLVEILKKPVQYFAYPNGTPGLDYGSREITNLRNKGIRLALTTEYRHIKKDDSPLEVPRFEISGGSKPKLWLKLRLLSSWQSILNIVSKTETMERKELISLS